MPAPLVEIERLTVDFYEREAWVNVVNEVSFTIAPGETLGLVGESGCGKTTTAYALFGYIRPGSRIRSGVVRFDDRDILRVGARELRSLRGGAIGLVPQNPAGSLTPSMRVGAQVVEAMEAHGLASDRSEAARRTVELFREVGLPQPETLVSRYPHELSGGQQQRVITAMALACEPKLLVLDEPTTALDVTTQARILRLLARLRAQRAMAMLYVTHNLGVVAQICDRVAVMYAGELVEVAPTDELFRRPRHPYTQGLLAAVPRLAGRNGTEARLRGLLRRAELPPGCRFAPRCAFAEAECFASPQTLMPTGTGGTVACRRWTEIEHLREPPRTATVAER
jgi:peptide/nickel transport system ATP-binding protein